MCEVNLNFQILLDNKDLVAEKVLECIDKNFSIEEQEKIYVAEIDTKYIDGIGLCNHYNIPRKQGANCLIVECIRKDIKKYVALLIPVGYKFNMSSTVRKKTNSRMVSVANLNYVLEKTKVEENSINPLCIPPTWPIYVDPKLLDIPNIICGSGLQKSKLLIPSKYLLKLPNVELVADLAKEIKEEKNE